jgi:hypothetical protein
VSSDFPLPPALLIVSTPFPQLRHRDLMVRVMRPTLVISSGRTIAADWMPGRGHQQRPGEPLSSRRAFLADRLIATLCRPLRWSAMRDALARNPRDDRHGDHEFSLGRTGRMRQRNADADERADRLRHGVRRLSRSAIGAGQRDGRRADRLRQDRGCPVRRGRQGASGATLCRVAGWALIS